MNGWANSDSPWSNAGAALEKETDIPSWRRPADSRTFGRTQFPPAQPLTPPGFLENSTEIPPSGSSEPVAPVAPWTGERSRLADILGHRRSPSAPPTTTPSSAPPYPYEGDLDDSYREKPTAAIQRASMPMTRPEWTPTAEPEIPKAEPVERSRHALVTDTLAQGLPHVETAPAGDRRTADNPAVVARPSYDSAGFAHRSYEPAPTEYAHRGPDQPETSGALPQRVPAQPDVPRVPEPPSVEPSAEAPALARIATHLRRGDVLPAQERQEGFDVQDILAAVREVDGVRDASLRATPAGAHSLRLDLADGADPAEVSRQVARLLQDRMGLDAAMPGDGPMPPLVPGQAARASRVSGPAMQASAPPAPAPISAAPMPAPVSAPPPVPAAPAAPARPREVSTAAPARSRQVSTAPPAAPVSPGRPREVRAALVPADASRPRPLDPGDNPGPRVVIENVHVNTFGADATVEVRLRAGTRAASGVATGPAVDGYLLRLCATATAGAIDELLSTSQHEDGPARCFVEHAGAVPFGSTQVAVVVLLLSCSGGWVEQLAGSAVVTGDDRHAMVRATLAALNRRVEALLA
ncbi:Daple [Actinoplanes sp. NPDC051861]|uniref:Daple n=1 Tax=Actinoplanes sp. NPDC051861 TaxID=3155170 RepID=UPI00341F2438